MPTANLNNIEIFYEFTGEGPPILFLAGMGLDLSIWYPVTELLEDRFTCVLMDNRGAGSSEAPMGPYTIGNMANDVASLLEGLDKSNAIVVGHSMGGCIAQQLSLDHPSLVAGLVLVGTSFAGRSDDLGSTAEARAALARTTGSPEEIVRGNMTVSVSPNFRIENSDEFERLIGDRLANRARGRGVAGQRAACAMFNVEDRVSQISCPTLVIHGTDDQIAAHDRGRDLAARIPGTEFVLLNGVGHMPQWEAPERLAREILRFLNRQRLIQ